MQCCWISNTDLALYKRVKNNVIYSRSPWLPAKWSWNERIIWRYDQDVFHHHTFSLKVEPALPVPAMASGCCFGFGSGEDRSESFSPLMVPSNRAGIVRSADYCVTWSLVPSWDMWLLFAEDCNSVSVSFPPSLPLLCVIICVITIDLRIQKIISLLGWLASVNSTWIFRDKLNLDVP